MGVESHIDKTGQRCWIFFSAYYIDPLFVGGDKGDL